MAAYLYCSSVQLSNSKVSQGGLLNVVCLYLWCGLKGYWVSCVAEAGSLRDYCWAGNRQSREYTEACLCPWPHFDQRQGPSCIRLARGTGMHSQENYCIVQLEPGSEWTTSEQQKANILAFHLQCCTESHNKTTEWNASVVSGWVLPCLVSEFTFFFCFFFPSFLRSSSPSPVLWARCG